MNWQIIFKTCNSMSIIIKCFLNNFEKFQLNDSFGYEKSFIYYFKWRTLKLLVAFSQKKSSKHIFHFFSKFYVEFEKFKFCYLDFQKFAPRLVKPCHKSKILMDFCWFLCVFRNFHTKPLRLKKLFCSNPRKNYEPHKPGKVILKLFLKKNKNSDK